MSPDSIHITGGVESGNHVNAPIPEETLEHHQGKTGEESTYIERMREVVLKGRADMASGRYVEGTEEFLAAMEERTASRG